MKTLFLRTAAALVAALALLAVLGYVYYLSLGIDKVPRANPGATVANLEYMQRALPPTRGRILAIVSSAAYFPDGKKKAGYELTELSRAYYVFKANGFEVDIASPQGGKPPVRIDLDDMDDSDYAFLNDQVAQQRVASSFKLAQVDPARYVAVYFVGGKGVMFDLVANPQVQRIVAAIAPRGVVGAVCHGPAALVDVRLPDGSKLVAGRRMTATSNPEELFITPNAAAVFLTLLQDRITQAGAQYSSGPLFLDHTVTDARLVTGQNPWSTWSTAEAMVRALGYTPLRRTATREEHSVRILAAYYKDGFEAARAMQIARPGFDKMLLLMHAVVAGMEWRVGDAFQLQRLANQ